MMCMKEWYLVNSLTNTNNYTLTGRWFQGSHTFAVMRGADKLHFERQLDIADIDSPSAGLLGEVVPISSGRLLRG